MQIQQYPSFPCPANQNLKGDVFRQKFVKLSSEMLSGPLWKKSLTGDTRARRIFDCVLDYKHL
jgi:hypothetical protein